MNQIGMDWHLLGSPAVKVLAAYLLSFPTGWFREKEGHAVGIRTFPIVAMAACGYMLILQDPSVGAGDISRVLQGLVAGIGFVGGGAIVKEGMSVHGTATAASIWNMGAMGAAVALGRWEIAVVLALLNLITMEALVPVKRKLDADDTGKLPPR